jgi:hypothetical protein
MMSSLNHSLSSRNLLILFFSALGVSLVVLLLCWLFFKNLDFSFHTKTLDPVPSLATATNAPLEAPAESEPPLPLETLLNQVRLNVPGEMATFKANKLTPEGSVVSAAKPANKAPLPMVGVGLSPAEAALEIDDALEAPPVPLRRLSNQAQRVTQKEPHKPAAPVEHAPSLAPLPMAPVSAAPSPETSAPLPNE